MKCRPWPLLAKQLINVWFCDILVLLNHLNNVARNWSVFVGCSEISISVIAKHVQDVGIIRAFFYLGGLFQCLGGHKKLLGYGLLEGIITPRLTLELINLYQTVAHHH